MSGYSGGDGAGMMKPWKGYDVGGAPTMPFQMPQSGQMPGATSGFMNQMQGFGNQMEDWRDQRPKFAQGEDRGAFRDQIDTWRDQRPAMPQFPGMSQMPSFPWGGQQPNWQSMIPPQAQQLMQGLPQQAHGMSPFGMQGGGEVPQPTGGDNAAASIMAPPTPNPFYISRLLKSGLINNTMVGQELRQASGGPIHAQDGTSIDDPTVGDTPEALGLLPFGTPFSSKKLDQYGNPTPNSGLPPDNLPGTPMGIGPVHAPGEVRPGTPEETGPAQTQSPMLDSIEKKIMSQPFPEYHQPTLFGKPLTNTDLALFSAGAGMLGGRSPFAGVNIGQGAQQGLGTLAEFQKLDASRQAQYLERAIMAESMRIRAAMLPVHAANTANEAAKIGYTTTSPGYVPQGDYGVTTLGGGAAPSGFSPVPNVAGTSAAGEGTAAPIPTEATPPKKPSLSMDYEVPTDLPAHPAPPKDAYANATKENQAYAGAYNAAENQAISLSNMTNDAIHVMRTPDAMVMGAGAKIRASYGAAINTLATAFGEKPPINENEIADITAMEKGGAGLAFGQINQAEGRQRIAAYFYDKILSLNPNPDMPAATYADVSANIFANTDYLKSLSTFGPKVLNEYAKTGQIPANVQASFDNSGAQEQLMKRKEFYKQAMLNLAKAPDNPQLRAHLYKYMKEQGANPLYLGLTSNDAQ